MIRVYVAGPVHGSGTQAKNLHNSLLVAEYLVKRGFVPFVPHLFFTWETMFGHTAQDMFLMMCMEWLSLCHVVVRLPGVSPGSDMECARARELGIPVVECTHMFNEGEELDKLVRDVADAIAASPVAHTFHDLQRMTQEWLARQPYGAAAMADSTRPAMGVVEEVGELREAMVCAMEVRSGAIARAVLKMKDGTRGTPEQHTAAMRDAIGDINVFSAGFAANEEHGLHNMVNASLRVVLARDWSKYPKNGTTE